MKITLVNHVKPANAGGSVRLGFLNHSHTLRLGLLFVSLSCARDLPGENPPAAALYFPGHVSVSADQRYAYVVNTNFDLRYNAGWISVIDLDVVLNAQNSSDDTTAPIVNQVKTLSLGGQLALTPDKSRAVLPHRGSASLTLLDLAGTQVSCGDPNQRSSTIKADEHTDCDDAHLVHYTEKIDSESTTTFLDAFQNSATIEIEEVSDPYAATFAPTHLNVQDGLALVVGHLSAGERAGWLFVFDASKSDSTLKPLRSVRLGLSGVGDLIGHPVNQNSFVVGTSQVYSSESVLSTLYSLDLDRTLAEDKVFLDWHSVNSAIGGSELMSLVFSPDGQRGFAVNRSPDSIVVLDTALSTVTEKQPDGTSRTYDKPKFSVISATALQNRPMDIAYLDRDPQSTDSQGDLLVVSSFDDDALLFLQRSGVGLHLVGRIDSIGMGPFGLAVAHYSGRELLLITTFYDHGLAIYDISAEQPAGFVKLASIRSPKVKIGSDAR